MRWHRIARVTGVAEPVCLLAAGVALTWPEDGAHWWFMAGAIIAGYVSRCARAQVTS